MRICHVTAHLPPEQGASALLPVHLGAWARDAGDTPVYLAYPPRALGGATPPSGSLPGEVVWVPARKPRNALARTLRVPDLGEVRRIWACAGPVFASADVVHVHSNGLLPEAGAWIASRMRKPTVLTLYGTEIWHYSRKWLRPDPFTRAYTSAGRVTFYSRGLLDRAMEFGLSREGLSVIYPPVADYFTRADPGRREAARRALGITERHLLLNVKRLHPLAGQQTIIDAMPAVLDACPDTRLVFCGIGPLREALEARAREHGVAGRVTFAGLVDNRTVASYYGAADLFVLPSQLEALPTVAIEALACGTPVVSTDNPGGVELARLFGDDVRVVPRGDAAALAAAVTAALQRGGRTGPRTDAVLEQEFRPATVAARFSAVYQDLLSSFHL